MGKMRIAAAVLAVLGVAGCQKKQVVADDSLSRDLALASSSDGLVRVPLASGQQVVSAIEQLPHRRVAHAPVKRLPQPPRPVEGVPQVIITPVVAPARGPVMNVLQPRPVDVSDPVPVPASDPVTTSPQPGQSDGHRGWGAAIRGLGVVIQGGGVVIRGGVGDGYHCDPRSNPIAINNQMPRLR